MSKGRPEPEPAPDNLWADLGLVSPDALPDELIAADFVDRRADRGIAFAHIGHTIESMGIGVGDARYFRYPLSSSVERQVIVAHLQGRFGNEVRVFLNDEFPHPAPSLEDVRRKRMMTLVASDVGKRAICATSYMDGVMGESMWWSVGAFVGPHIVRDNTLAMVEVRGRPSHVLAELPHPDANTCGPGAPERTDAALHLEKLLDSIPLVHAEDHIGVLMPTPGTLAVKLEE